jgi:hypothetical protein
VWVRENVLGKQGCRLKLTLETTGKERARKKTVLQEFKKLVEGEELVTTWKKHKYCFDFMKRKYFWCGSEVYLTASEELFLYRLLILNDDICKLQTHHLRHMRRRLGKEFLSDETK